MEETEEEELGDLEVLSSLIAEPQQPTESVVELDQQHLTYSESLAGILHQLKLPTKDVTLQYLEGMQSCRSCIKCNLINEHRLLSVIS